MALRIHVAAPNSGEHQCIRMQPLPEWYVALQQETAARFDAMMECQRQSDAKHSALMQQVFGILTTMQLDVQALKNASVSTGSSMGRFVCPMNCGADFSKVPYCFAYVIIVCTHVVF